jgi:hypothetical protein
MKIITQFHGPTFMWFVLITIISSTVFANTNSVRAERKNSPLAQVETPTLTPTPSIANCTVSKFNVAEHYSSIQAAIDNTECTFIYVDSGIYTETVTIW